MLYMPREEGQGLVEYALILVLIAVVVIVLLTALGGQVQSTFSTIVSGMGG
jgi:pilus assembly protein Flp/PilA